MSAEKSNFSFKFSFGRRTHLSYICLGILVVTATISFFVVAVVNDRKAARLAESRRPKVNLDGWKKDIQAYHDKTGKYAKNLRELENVIWKVRDNTTETKLTNGDSFYVLDNYLVIYNGNDQVCSLWAVPLGAAREDGNTYFLLIAPKQIQTWKGAALTTDDIERVPRVVVPTDVQMARLGMSMQDADKSNEQPKKQTFFSPFGRK